MESFGATAVTKIMLVKALSVIYVDLEMARAGERVMRFKEFLQENESFTNIDKFIAAIKQDCKPFLKMYKSEMSKDSFLCRAMNKNDIKGKMSFTEPRKDRRPSDTPRMYQNIMDKWLNGKFGFNYRSSGVFASFNKSFLAMEFGSLGAVHYIFPVGNFKFCYSTEVKDLYVDRISGMPIEHIIKSTTPEYFLSVLFGKDITKSYKEAREMLEDILDTIKQTEYEIMLGKDVQEDTEYAVERLGRDLQKCAIFKDKEDILNNITIDNFKKFIKEIITAILDDADYKEEADMSDTPRGEVMLQCDGYYAINSDDLQRHHTEFFAKLFN